MRRLLAFALSGVFAVGPLPTQTARWVEGARKRALEGVTGTAHAVAACPPDHSFFTFLEREQQRSLTSGALWRPLCRKTDPPLGKVAVLADEPESFLRCQAGLSVYQTALAHCWLEPKVTFLARPQAPRTFARLIRPDSTGAQILWATAEPLAWEERLEREDRVWVAGSFLIALGAFMMLCTRRRWIEAGRLQHQMRSSGAVLPSAAMERLLLCVMPKFNFPQEVDDLRELYAELAESAGEVAAKRWYTAQVRGSLVFYAMQWSANALRRFSARPSTSGH